MEQDGRTATWSGENSPRKEEDSPGMPEMTMDKRADLAISVFIASLGVFVLITSRNIRAGTISDPITARGLPTAMGAFLIIGGFALAMRQLLHWSELPGHLVLEEGQEDEKGYPASAVRAISIIFLSMLWGWFLNPMGFLFVTPLYMVVCSWVMKMQSWVKMTAFSVIYTISAWLIFGPLMGIRLPLGPLESLARSLGLIS